MTRQASLLVNDQPIELDYFVQGFLDHTIGGMVAALEGIGEIESMDISIEGNEVTINVNNAPVAIKPFVSEIFRNTIAGMLSSLKGVSEVNKVKMAIKR